MTCGVGRGGVGRVSRAVGLGAMLVLAGCGTKVLPLAYTAPANPVHGSAQVRVGASVDQRRDNDPTWYGAIRGGYGNPLSVLRSDVPVSQAVSKAFGDALAARGMLARGDGGRYEVRLAVTRFEASRYVRLEAHVDLRAQVVEAASGRVVHEGQGQANKVSGSIFALDSGIFASPTELSNLMAAALTEAVDKIVDDPGFRRAVGDASVPVG